MYSSNIERPDSELCHLYKDVPLYVLGRCVTPRRTYIYVLGRERVKAPSTLMRFRINRFACTLPFSQRFQLSTLKRSKTLTDMCRRLNNMRMFQKYVTVIFSAFYGSHRALYQNSSRPSIWCS